MALTRQGGEVAAVALKAAEGVLGVLAGDALVAADGGEGLQDGVGADVMARQQRVGRGDAGQRQQQMLATEVVVAHVFGLRGGGEQRFLQGASGADLRVLAGDARFALQLFIDIMQQRAWLRADAGHHAGREAIVLAQQGGQQMQGPDGGMALLDAEGLRGQQGFAGLVGIAFEVHRNAPVSRCATLLTAYALARKRNVSGAYEACWRGPGGGRPHPPTPFPPWGTGALPGGRGGAQGSGEAA